MVKTKEEIEAAIAHLDIEMARLRRQLATVQPARTTLYTCTRCGLLYQSQFGCGCANAAANPAMRRRAEGRAKEGDER